MRFLSILALLGAMQTQAATINGEEAITFTTSKGETTAAFSGHFTVPENRSKPSSRTLTLRYVRFPATGPNAGPPIVYLAGGPGGSGIDTAKYRSRYALFMALREFGDVIALDQRGTGASDDTPECISAHTVPTDRPVPDSEYTELHRQALRDCLAFWRNSGVDVSGYNTRESVQDLVALRQHLGADKLVLWGISYGSHLALAALKDIDAQIHKVIIASAEGLEQTIKLPARTDAYFARLQQAAAANGTDIGEVPALLKRVHAALDDAPLKLNIPGEDDATWTFVLQRRHMQQFTASSIADPRNALQVLALYQAVDAGFTAPLIAVVKKYLQPHQPIQFRAMPVAMDLASGMGAERRRLIASQARTALLGDWLNFTYHLTDAAPELDLGDMFRRAPESAVPTLLLSGTLDGRTYIESQREAVSGLSNAHLVTVENAGHNLFMSSPEVTAVIQAFMRGESKLTTRIQAPL